MYEICAVIDKRAENCVASSASRKKAQDDRRSSSQQAAIKPKGSHLRGHFADSVNTSFSMLVRHLLRISESKGRIEAS